MILSELNVFPVKSFRGISPDSATVELLGFADDRRWMAIGGDNRFLSQREFPLMATISTSLDAKGLILRSGINEVRVPRETDDSIFESVGIWNDTCRAAICSAVINDWLSEVLGARCRLVRMPDETRRAVDADYAFRDGDHVSFADAFPFLLLGEASLAELNSKLDTPVPMNRFRPNLVVSGSDAFAEDSWKRIKIGATVFRVVKPCVRCVIPTIDQETGIKAGVEPLRTLGEFRTFERNGVKKILFGQNLIPEIAGGKLMVGDRLEVLD